MHACITMQPIIITVLFSALLGFSLMYMDMIMQTYIKACSVSWELTCTPACKGKILL